MITVNVNDTIEILNPYNRYKVLGVSGSSVKAQEWFQDDENATGEAMGKTITLNLAALEAHAKKGQLFINGNKA